jgi:hypothetical protein
MDKLHLADVQPAEQYEQHRAAFLRRIIQVKQARRVLLGAQVTLLFENRETAWFQVQEVLRGEFTAPERIQEELDIYNELIPEANELRATLFIELPELLSVDDDVRAFAGVEQGVRLRFADCLVYATTDSAWRPDPAGRVATVHYLRFSLTPEQSLAFAQGPIYLEADFGRYCASTKLNEMTAAVLGEELLAASAPAR